MTQQFHLFVNLLWEIKLLIWKGICSPVFIVALFTIAKLWEQPKCPLIDEGIKKLRYKHTMEYYSATKKNEILTFVTTWTDQEDVRLSGLSQAEKDTYHLILLIYGI